jgi:hypothetical protein
VQLAQRQLGGGGVAVTVCAVAGHRGRGPRGRPNAAGRNACRALVLVWGMPVGVAGMPVCASSGHDPSTYALENYTELKPTVANTV